MKRIIITLLAILFLNGYVSAQVAVIANKNVSVNEIDKDQLIEFYKMDKTQRSDGTTVLLVDLGVKGAIKDQFYSFLGATSKKMKQIWMKKMLSGDGQAPDALSSEDAVVNKVASTPGAIGYVSADKAGDDVKVLLVIK